MAQQARIVSTKLTPAQVLYMEDGGAKRCDRCIMWVSDVNRCTILGPTVEVKANMICGLYVYGTPTTSERADIVAHVEPQEVGLGWGDTSCGNCRYGDGASNCGHPGLQPFPIDNQGGCCNAWTQLPGEPDKELP